SPISSSEIYGTKLRKQQPQRPLRAVLQPPAPALLRLPAQHRKQQQQQPALHPRQRLQHLQQAQHRRQPQQLPALHPRQRLQHSPQAQLRKQQQQHPAQHRRQ
ncbi:unnamed protein product, partial [Rotaria sp. Silwood1]